MGPEQDSVTPTEPVATPPSTDPAVTPTEEPTPAPADSQPADEAPAETETPQEDASEPSEDPTQTETTPEVETPATPDLQDSLVALNARVTKLEAEMASCVKAEPTPAEEAADQVADSRAAIDGSGILLETNDEVIAAFPRNENGQVEIDSDGQVVGLDTASQPSVPSGSVE